MRTYIASLTFLAVAAGCSDTSPKASTNSSPVAAATTDPVTTTVPVVKEAPPPPPVVVYTPSNTGLPEGGMWKCDPVFADFNGDGHTDLAAIPRLGDGTHVWLGNGKGEWTDSSNGLNPGSPSCGGGLDVADLNKDGHLDLAIADHCNGIFIALGDGAGNWELVVKAMSPTDLFHDENAPTLFAGTEDVSIGDVDGDGNLDLLAGASSEGGIYIYLGDGTGREWKMHPIGLPLEGWANRVLLHDLNGDDRLDVVASRGEGPRVWLNDGKGNWYPSSVGLPEPIIGGLYHGLSVGDVNKDGRPDIAVSNWIDGPEVYLQQATGAWQKMPDVFPKLLGGTYGVTLGDLDGDDRVDLVCSGRLKVEGGYVRGVFALRSTPDGAWQYMPNCGLPTTGLGKTTGVAIGDVNGDGIADIAACSGLKIESVPGGKKPVIAAHVMVWTGAMGPGAEPIANASAVGRSDAP